MLVVKVLRRIAVIRRVFVRIGILIVLMARVSGKIVKMVQSVRYRRFVRRTVFVPAGLSHAVQSGGPRVVTAV